MYGKNVWEALLRNPRLTAPEVARIARMGQLPRPLIEIIVGSDEKLRLKMDAAEPEAVLLPQLAARVKNKQGGNADVPVVISADKSVRYESVVRVMDTLQRAGVRRVGLSVKQGPS